MARTEEDKTEESLQRVSPAPDYAFLRALDGEKNLLCFGRGKRPEGVRDPLFTKRGIVHDELEACLTLPGSPHLTILRSARD